MWPKFIISLLIKRNVEVVLTWLKIVQTVEYNVEIMDQRRSFLRKDNENN